MAPVRRQRSAPPAGAPRAEQVRATRRRVLDAARELFLRRGYAGTTVDAVAHRAGVSPQTVYNVVGGKADVLKAVYDVALAGDDEPVTVVQRPHVAAIMAAPDLATAVRLYVAAGRAMLERAGPLVPILFVHGGGQDPQVRALVETIERERASGMATVARCLAERFGLRDGLSAAEAGDVLWSLLAPELADRLLRRCGWSLDRYEAWVAQTLIEILHGPDAS